MVTISIVKQIKKYNSFRFILEFNSRYNTQQGSFSLATTFSSFIVILFFYLSFEWVIHNFRTKSQSRLWVVLHPLPTPCRSPQKTHHNKLRVVGEWLRQRVIGLGTPQISRSLVHIQSACVWWMVCFPMGRLLAHHEMVISACALRRWWFIAS